MVILPPKIQVYLIISHLHHKYLTLKIGISLDILLKLEMFIVPSFFIGGSNMKKY